MTHEQATTALFRASEDLAIAQRRCYGPGWSPETGENLDHLLAGWQRDELRQLKDALERAAMAEFNTRIAEMAKEAD